MIMQTENMREVVGNLTPKEVHEKRNEEIDELGKRMDQNFTKAKEGFEEATEKQDTDTFRNLWSNAVEEAYIKALGVSKGAEKTLRGRGEIMRTTKTPTTHDKTGSMRNEWSYKALRCLKQARRGE